MSRFVVAAGADGVRLARLLPGPIERVWTYLTDSRKRATWLATGEFELRLGGRVQLTFDNDSLSPGVPAPAAYREQECSFTGQITRFEPPHALAFTWAGGKHASEVTFELVAQGEEVMLTITHRQLTDRKARVGVAGGWDTHVGILVDRLNGVEPKPFWATHARLARDYEARL